MIYATIEHSDGDRTMVIYAENMKELIDVKLPQEAPKLADDIRLLKTTKRLKADPSGAEKQERESGWYYDC